MRTYLLIATFFFASQSFSQSKLPPFLIDAQQTATKENKLIMLVVQSPTCNQCNAVAEAGMKNIRKRLEENCVIVTNMGVPTGIFSIPSLFLISNEFFGVIWFDKEFNLLYVRNGSISLQNFYLEAMQAALSEEKSGNSFKFARENYLKDVKGFSTVFTLLNKIKAIGFEAEQTLIDELVQKAPSDSAYSLSFLSQVLKFAPGVGSIALTYVQKNQDDYKMAWYRMSLKERVNINNRIAYKSIQKAIQEKNVNYANQVAWFRQSTYQDKPEEGAKGNMQIMLEYYKGIGDTINYMKQAFNFYDRYFMQVTAADIKREDSLMLIKYRIAQDPGIVKMQEAALDQLPDSVKALLKNSKGVFGKQVLTYAPKAQYYANTLNEGAFTIYQYTNNITYLAKALQMARKALEFFETPELADTYARLLYKTGNKIEAINWQKKAIELNNKRGYNSSVYETVLKKMEKGEVKID